MEQLYTGGLCMKRVLLLLVFLLFTTQQSTHALSWAYPFVVWKGNVYEVTEEKVPESEIGKVIGKVKWKANDMSGEYFGDASNMYTRGTKYYAINRISAKSAFAVEVQKNEWQKAVYADKAPFHWMNVFIKALPYLILAVGIVIVIVIVLRREKVR